MTTIEIDRSSLGGHDDSDAQAYAAYLADYLEQETGDTYRIRLGAGGSPPEGHRELMQDAWDAWCRLSAAEHEAWRARA